MLSGSSPTGTGTVAPGEVALGLTMASSASSLCTYGRRTPGRVGEEDSMATPRAVRKSDRLGLRLSAAQSAVLRAASEAEGTAVTDFVLRSAMRAAEASLAGRRAFVIDEERWAELSAALDRPPAEVPGLRELLDSPSVFDEE